MKKLLFGILTVFGIGFSFCSADGIYRSPDDKLTSVKFPGSDIWITYEAYYHGFSSGYMDPTSPNYLSGYYYQFGNIHPFLKSGNNVVTLTGPLSISPYPPTPPYFNTDIAYYLTSNNESIYPISPSSESSLFYYDSIYSGFQFQGPCDTGYHIFNYSELVFLSNNYESLGYNDTNFCSDFFNLPIGPYSNNKLVQFNLSLNSPQSVNSYHRFIYLVGGKSENTSLSNIITYSITCVPGYTSFGTRHIAINYQQRLFPIFCFKDTPVEPDYTWRVITGDIIEAPTLPKFKVNYGNTSYEYELTDNLSIHLKSPVVMSGTTDYIYDGSTGINLFFNGSSQRYSKSELYLNTPSWYNNNIFTPICL